MDLELKSAEEISQMITEKKFSGLKEYLVEINPADIAELLNELPKEQYMVLYRLLPKELAAEVFVGLDSDLQEMLGISKPAVYELIKRKEFRWVMIGGRYKISKRSFDEWLDGSFDTAQAPLKDVKST